ncbi:MAG: hypothetical protein LLG00_07795 [Planctomycetaceae bacterium]|nr:hypothetical protein [Planctomycetaceae bacterium]
MAKTNAWLTTLSHTPGVSDLPSHSPGTIKGEEWILRSGREPGRDDPNIVRTARDSTSLNPKARDPIDPRMPHIPPA